MTAATWMAGLLLVANAGPADTFYIKERHFLVPIGIHDPSRLPNIKEVILFLASPDGKTWNRYGVTTPDKEGFPFKASDDGVYLFKMAVVGRSSSKPEDGEPRYIVVDTVPPVLRPLSAERQGDDVLVRWQVEDKNPDYKSLKLEYRASDAPDAAWTALPVTAPDSGQATVHVTGPAVAVRLSVADMAKNESGWVEMAVKNGGSTSVAAGKDLPPLGGDGSQAPGQLPPPVADRAWSPTGGEKPPTGVLTRTGGHTGGDAGEATGAGGRPTVVGAGGGEAAPPAPRPTRPLLPVKMLRKRQVTIDYEVTTYGPSGIKSVELYVTRDDGRNWLRCDGEDNISVPLPAEGRPAPAGFKRSLTVELQADGLYGFYLVVTNGAGRGKPPPQNGIDVPQMRVEVDTTAPKAEVIEPMPHPTRRDCLVLLWKATDNKLGPTPITWEWAERPDGDWQPIGGGELPNAGDFVGQVRDATGSYTWQVPTTIPRGGLVYLRLRVRDLAGNECVAQTPQPVLVDLSEPEVKPLDINVSAR
jgi:hypothetical protein